MIFYQTGHSAKNGALSMVTPIVRLSFIPFFLKIPIRGIVIRMHGGVEVDPIVRITAM